MLKKLVQISSISGNEIQIQKYILHQLASYGYKPFNLKGNIIQEIKGDNHTKCLIFNVHVDTVSSGLVEKWKHDPFSGKEINGKIYGLGASDEKASIATLLILAEKYSKVIPPCDIWLTFVVGEEVDGHGTKDFLEWFTSNKIKSYKKVNAVLGEPTGLKRMEIAHKGNIFLRVTTIGKSGHASRLQKDENHAILAMMKVIEILHKLGKKWKYMYKDLLLGNPTIAVATSISGGDVNTPNKYPDSCVSTFDIRTTPLMHTKAFSEVYETINNKKVKVEFLYPPVGCGYTSKNSEIVKIFKKITKKKFSVSEGSNDMYFFTKKGIPAVVFGPGSNEVIHKPNEYCTVSNILKCAKIYEKVISDFAQDTK